MPFLAPLLTGIIGWFLKSLALKLLVLAFIFVIMTTLLPAVLGLMPGFVKEGDAGLSDLFNGLPAGVLYMLELFKVPAGILILLSCLIARFVLRRIPFIG